MKREETVTCIMCPLGCKIKVELENDEIKDLVGHACENGMEYAEQEVSSPTRTVMSVVKCVKGDYLTVSIKTSEPVKKDKIDAVMGAVSNIEVEAPVRVGDKIIEDVCGLGVDIVATRNVERDQE